MKRGQRSEVTLRRRHPRQKLGGRSYEHGSRRFGLPRRTWTPSGNPGSGEAGLTAPVRDGRRRPHPALLGGGAARPREARQLAPRLVDSVGSVGTVSTQSLGV
jgi:hypothetical protein